MGKVYRCLQRFIGLRGVVHHDEAQTQDGEHHQQRGLHIGHEQTRLSIGPAFHRHRAEVLQPSVPANMQDMHALGECAMHVRGCVGLCVIGGVVVGDTAR